MTYYFFTKMAKKVSVFDEYVKHHNELVEKYGKRSAVLMQVGDFYELYFDNNGNGCDMELIENEIRLNPSGNDEENNKRKYRMFGFNICAIDKYKEIFLDRGFTIAIYNQFTDPKNIKGPKLRRLVSIESKTTYIEGNSMSSSTYIMSLYIYRNRKNKENLLIGVTLLDLLTGKSLLYETGSSDNSLNVIEDISCLINIYNPSEFLINFDSFSFDKESSIEEKKELLKEFINLFDIDVNRKKYYTKMSIPKEILNVSTQNNFLGKIFTNTGKKTPIEWLNIAKYNNAIISLIIVLEYALDHNENIVKGLDKPEYYHSKNYMIMGNDAIRQLNILDNTYLDSDIESYRCVYDVVKHTQTIAGKRFLKDCLCNPLTEPQEIKLRYNFANYLIEHNDLSVLIKDTLKIVPDIDRLHRRMNIEMLFPSNICSLVNCYKKIRALLRNIKSNHLHFYNLLKKQLDIKTLKLIKNVYREISSDINLKIASKYNNKDIDENFYKKGIHTELDDIQSEIFLAKNIITKLSNVINNYIEENSTGFVEYKSNKISGFMLSLTKRKYDLFKKNTKEIDELEITNKISIPIKDLNIKINKNTVNITSKWISKYSNKIEDLKLELNSKIKPIFNKFMLDIFTKYKTTFLELSKLVSYLDYYQSNAVVATKFSYVKPKIAKNKSESSYIKSTNLRHCLSERNNRNIEYVPNDVDLGNDTNGVIVFGINGAGKTVYMKSVGIALVMAQAGMFVPASKFTYYPYNSLYARITGNDNIIKGLSSFEVEMNELLPILQKSNKNTLVIGDEICRGTEQNSGEAIVAGTIDTLVNVGASFIFASHLHGITELETIKKIKTIKYFHIKVDYDKSTQKCIYNRKLEQGIGPQIYGNLVARSILKDHTFMNKVDKILEDEVFKKEKIKLKYNETSKYNKNLIVDCCNICKSTENLETHHINFQSNCENDKVIDREHISKNDLFNLVVLCNSCHKDVHFGGNIINGYKETSDGIILDYFTDSNYGLDDFEIKRIKKITAEYDNDTICCNSTLKEIVKKLKDKHNITINKYVLKKIL